MVIVFRYVCVCELEIVKCVISFVGLQLCALLYSTSNKTLEKSNTIVTIALYCASTT